MFEEEPWRVASLSSTHTPTLSLDHLVECMADISGLFADANKTELTPQEGSVSTPARRAPAQAILDRLYSWRWSWEAQHGDSVSQQAAHDASVFGIVVHFDNPQLLYDIWLYDALLILVLNYLNGLDHSSRSEEPIPQTSGLLKPDQVLLAQQPAIEICRCLDYQMLNLAFPAPIHQWALPLALAYVTLPPASPVAAWVLSKIETAPQRFSVPWVLYIERLQTRDPNHSWAIHLDSTTVST